MLRALRVSDLAWFKRWGHPSGSAGRSAPQALHDARVAPVVGRTLHNFALVALAFRAVAMVISMTGTISSRSFGPVSLRQIVSVGAVLLAVDLGLLWFGFRSRLPTPRSWLMVLDLAVAGAVNLWASTVIPPQTLFFDYRNPFGFYAMGSLAIWTGIKGPRVGAAILVGLALPLQLGMALANRIPLDAIDWAKFASRGLWSLVGFLMAVLVLHVSRKGATRLVAVSQLAGREVGRADMLQEPRSRPSPAHPRPHRDLHPSKGRRPPRPHGPGWSTGRSERRPTSERCCTATSCSGRGSTRSWSV
jgi:hypothetical protein